jgi:hypothetical protein
MADESTDALDALPTKELHDRAVHHAERHLDVKFFWSLLELIPAAQAARSDVTQEETKPHFDLRRGGVAGGPPADLDILSTTQLVSDAIHSGEGGLAEALRPVFIDYLRKHPDA